MNELTEKLMKSEGKATVGR